MAHGRLAIHSRQGRAMPCSGEAGDMRARRLSSRKTSVLTASAMPAASSLARSSSISRLASSPSPSSFWMASLPWAISSGSQVDVKRAAEILDEDHYDLEKVKERILDYLAVLQLRPVLKGPILRFVGPPGVGKTSLGRSIARALGRKFARISMGGM